MPLSTQVEEKSEQLNISIDDSKPKTSDDGNNNKPQGQRVKLNCWEFKKCGREPGGVNAEKLGVCPVPLETSLDGLHGGKNAGRACWALTNKRVNTSSESWLKNIRQCTQCEFHQMVVQEEEKYQSALSYIQKKKRDDKQRYHKEPGYIRHVFEKSKHTAFEESFEVDSLFISLLIGWVSLCPSVSMLEGSKRLCKNDLIDELMVIDAIADDPRRRALRTVAKTMFKALRRQVGSYFDPLAVKIRIKKKK
ncbi:Protein serine/threonine phosphatase [Candidatus Magnetoovum chiemensis]|nr:Protein serine/threonine phosphatase [Candidatus Magnetoovum chiemensis]